MKIAFAAALLLGLVSARTQLGSMTGTYDITNNGYFDVAGTYEFDCGYSTFFDFAEDSTTSYLWKGTYGLNVDASGYYKMDFTLMGDWLAYSLKAKVSLIDLYPFIQYITFTRPDAYFYDNTASYEVTVEGEREVYFGDVSLVHKLDAAVTSVSVYDAVSTFLSTGTFTLSDWVPSTDAQWALQDDDTVYFTDSYLAYNIAEDLLGLSTADWWYGTQQWYEYTLTL